MKFYTKKDDWYPHEGIRTAFANTLKQPEVVLALSVLRDERIKSAKIIQVNGVANGAAAQQQARDAGFFECLMEIVELAEPQPVHKEPRKGSGWIDRPLYSNEDQIPKTK